MGRRERALDPTAGPLETFAHDLRQLRHAAGNPGYRPLARRAGYSASALSAAAGGRTLPSLAVTLAYVGACGGDIVEWERRWEETAAKVAAEGDRNPPSATPVTPRELPPDVYGFTGRAGELAELDALDAAAVRSGAVVISAVSGTGGVGKTALAVHWAHRVADRFPDGHLYVDLRGYDPDQPLEPAEVLSAFLRALGLTGADVPYEVAERTARYRTLVAGRRLLVVLDNAHSADQVRPLLPGSPGCLVLVTSRDSLAGLVARDGAHRVELDLLPPAEATRLLRTLIGRRVDDEPAAAAALAELCARLPLALRVAAEIAAAQPAMPLASLVAELDDANRRLDLLDAKGDRRTAVRGVFSWSYEQLPPAAARAFRLAGLHPGRDFDAYATAALAGTGVAEARQLVDVLVRAHLVERTAAGRLRMHDLLRAYAAERATDEPAVDRDAAMTRLYDFYLAAAADAVDAIYPSDRHRRPRVGPSTTPTPPLGEPVLARAWLDAERANLVIIAARTANRDWARYENMFTATIGHYLENCGHYAEALTVYRGALAAARAQADDQAEGDAQHRLGTILLLLGDHAGAAEHLGQALTLRRAGGDVALIGRTLNNLGNTYQRWGRFAEASEHFQQALATQQAVGDRRGEAVVRCSLADLYVVMGRYPDALDQYRRSTVLCVEVGERSGEGTTLAGEAFVLSRLGRYDEAAQRFRLALDTLRGADDRIGEIFALSNLGVAVLRLGNAGEAAGHAEAAVRLAVEIGDRMGEVGGHNNLGLVYRCGGRHAEAIAQYERTLELARESGYRGREIEALNGLGEALRAAGRGGEATAHHETALGLARDLHDREQQARALAGLAHTRWADGCPERARELWRAALTLYVELGVPEADEVRTHLDAVDGEVGAGV